MISGYLYFRLYDTALRLGELQAKCKVQVDPEEYVKENLKFGLVEVVYEWAKVLSLPLCGVTVFCVGVLRTSLKRVRWMYH